MTQKQHHLPDDQDGMYQAFLSNPFPPFLKYYSDRISFPWGSEVMLVHHRTSVIFMIKSQRINILEKVTKGATQFMHCLYKTENMS